MRPSLPSTDVKALLNDDEIAASLAERLDRVAARFAGQLKSDLAPVNALARHVERYRGKMLRPTLVIISGWAVREGEPADEAIDARLDTLAAVVEMIHMATLVHDDVLDEAAMRRGGQTVNSLKGNETAVMLGDFLISSAFHLCSSIGLPWLNSALGETTTQLCSGEILQLTHRGDLKLAQATYSDIIRRKTGVLSGACCGLAARLARADGSTTTLLERYGEDLGMAFQIQDDILDLVGDEKVVGKTLGIDLQKGKLTLPIVIHLARATPSMREETVKAIAECDRATLLRLVAGTESLAAARTEAMRFVESAKGNLTPIRESAARRLLSSIADATVERTY